MSKFYDIRCGNDERSKKKGVECKRVCKWVNKFVNLMTYGVRVMKKQKKEAKV